MKKNKVILWDLDGTLYEQTHSTLDQFHKAVFASVRKVINPAISDDQVLSMLEESRKKFGDSLSGFADAGHDHDALHEDLHNHLDHNLIQKDVELIEAFEKSQKAGIRHATLSHAHKDWVVRVLNQLDIAEFFDDADILSTEQIGYSKKHTGPEAFIKTANILGVKLEDIWMIEDKASNLLYPHSIGMETVLIHYNQAKAKAQSGDHIHHRFSKPQHVINHVLMSLTPQQVQPHTKNKNNPKP